MNSDNSDVFVSTSDIRREFARTIAQMYESEVPQYGALKDLVGDLNERTLQMSPGLKSQLACRGELERLGLERHGAIRLGTAQELFDARRVFAVMGMFPVGYYDLSVAGVPVHSTAFRPIGVDALSENPFRMFTSLLRLELIEDHGKREEVSRLLAHRKIFTRRALELTAQAVTQRGLTIAEAHEFVAEVLKTFQWHAAATVDADTYRSLLSTNRLLADVACF